MVSYQTCAMFGFAKNSLWNISHINDSGSAVYNNEKIPDKFVLPKKYWLFQGRENDSGGGDKDSFQLRCRASRDWAPPGLSS